MAPGQGMVNNKSRHGASTHGQFFSLTITGHKP